MSLKDLIYRQKQRLRYHFAKNDLERQIAEINRFTEQINILGENYLIKPLSLLLPRSRYDFIFNRFDLFISNCQRLNGEYLIRDNYLIFTWDNISIHLENAGELFIINEIFVNKCYQFRLPQHKNVKIIDIGMNVGYAALYFASLPWVKEVFAFEPFKSSIDAANINFSLNPALSPKIHPFNYGLGDKEEVLEAHFNPQNPGINTTTQDHPRLTDAEITETVFLKTARNEIDGILKSNTEERFMIKIDAEGAEYGILRNLFSQKLGEQIVGFMIEWHLKGPTELEDHLLGAGFKIFSFYLKQSTGIIYAYR